MPIQSHNATPPYRHTCPPTVTYACPLIVTQAHTDTPYTERLYNKPGRSREQRKAHLGCRRAHAPVRRAMDQSKVRGGKESRKKVEQGMWQSRGVERQGKEQKRACLAVAQAVIKLWVLGSQLRKWFLYRFLICQIFCVSLNFLTYKIEVIATSEGSHKN